MSEASSNTGRHRRAAGPRGWRAIACLLALPLALAACAAPSLTSTRAADLPNPCSLLRPQEVTAALDAPIREPVVEHEIQDAECTYDVGDDTSGKSVLVALTAIGPNTATFEKRAQFFQNEGARPLDGLGAAAYAKGGKILTQKPGIILYVEVNDDQRADQALLAAARTLTLAVLGRLP